MAGIACAGNWIVDAVKFIDTWPGRGELANILDEKHGGGGSPHNVLTDIAKLKLDIPLYGIGCVGGDSYGEFLREHCRTLGIDSEMLIALDDYPTSYTDVMTLQGSGERTFFHARGANALFNPDHVSIDKLVEKKINIFHFGYLLLLDSMDEPDPEFGTVAGRLLHQVKEAGIETSIDVVSESSDRFSKIVLPTLPYVDYCIINEVEAEKITGIEIRGKKGINRKALEQAAAKVIEKGVSKTVVIHFPEGSIWMDTSNGATVHPSYHVADSDILSSVGAGDAFCAGILAGIYEGWAPEEALKTASAIACACLFEASATGGICPLTDVKSKIGEKYRFREPNQTFV